jgi:hypothetical protein
MRSVFFKIFNFIIVLIFFINICIIVIYNFYDVFLSGINFVFDVFL